MLYLVYDLDDNNNTCNNKAALIFVSVARHQPKLQVPGNGANVLREVPA